MVNKKFSSYQVIEKIGGGNTGVVYKAFDPERKCSVALKILPNNFLLSDEKKARFTRETQAAGILKHPAIARLYKVGEYKGNDFIAMEYVDGKTYKEIIGTYPNGIQLRGFFKLILPVLDGMAYAHAQHLIHRDLKPDNLKYSSKGQPKVLDFGLVKFINKQKDDTSESFETMAGMVLGSAGYMSPEQAGGKALDARTDVFSLGIIMYELLTGKSPFEGRGPFDTIVKILNADPLSLELVRPDLPMELCNVIGRCLNKGVEDRYPDASAVHQAVAAIEG